MTDATNPKPTFDLEYIRDISEQVYRIGLNRDCGEGATERMIAKDKDGGEMLRNRAAAYDKLTRAYLKVLGFEPTALAVAPHDAKGGAE